MRVFLRLIRTYFYCTKKPVGIGHKFHNLDRLLSFPAFSWFINAGKRLKTPLHRALRIQTIYEIQVQNYQEMRQGSRVFFLFLFCFVIFFTHSADIRCMIMIFRIEYFFWLIFFFQTMIHEFNSARPALETRDKNCQGDHPPAPYYTFRNYIKKVLMTNENCRMSP